MNQVSDPPHAKRQIKPRDDLKEVRIKARLAWNSWPDNEDTRRNLTEYEERDPFSACAWDRVILAIVVSAQGGPRSPLASAGTSRVTAEKQTGALEADGLGLRASQAVEAGHD